MPTFCRFCRHGNPDGAKFCNECGSQLSLAPCPSCEAINDADASTCHQCGAALAPPAGPETTSAGHPVMAVAGDDSVEATAVLPASFLQNNGAVTDESIQPPAPGTPFQPAAHVPESFAESLAAKNPGDGMAQGSHRNAIDDARSITTHAPSTPAGSEGEDVDVGLREDLRAFRQSLGQQRRASLGGFAVIAIAVIAAGVGAYALYRSDAPLQRASKEVAANPTVEGTTASPAAASKAGDALTGKAGDDDSGIANSTSSGDGADGVIAPNTASTDSTRQSATASTEDTKSTMVDDVAPSSSSTSTPESRQAAAAGESPPSSPPAKTSKPRSVKTTRTANARNAANSRAPAVTPSPSAATVNRPSDADALATERLIARDLGRFGPTAPPGRSVERMPPDTRDRDASATQRLVDRDLGAFRNGSSATRPDRAFPEIN